MNTYLVNLECSFPDEHRAEQLELFVSVNAESPEHIEAPLRDLLIKAQAEAGFNKVHVNHITMVPTEPTVMYSFEHWKSGGVFVETESEWIEPAWYQALENPYSPEESAEVHARHVNFAAERGEPAPEWDGKESLGGTWSPFMEFPNATVDSEHAVPEASSTTPEIIPETTATAPNETPVDDSSGWLQVEEFATESG